jgi:hypothetical protein
VGLGAQLEHAAVASSQSSPGSMTPLPQVWTIVQPAHEGKLNVPVSQVSGGSTTPSPHTGPEPPPPVAPVVLVVTPVPELVALVVPPWPVVEVVS